MSPLPLDSKDLQTVCLALIQKNFIKVQNVKSWSKLLLSFLIVLLQITMNLHCISAAPLSDYPHYYLPTISKCNNSLIKNFKKGKHFQWSFKPNSTLILKTKVAENLFLKVFWSKSICSCTWSRWCFCRDIWMTAGVKDKSNKA